MTGTTAKQMRDWKRPVVLTYGFRPFFLGAAAWAALAMALWLPMLSGHLVLPSAFDPVSRHAHEFLFGYLGAVIGGFLLTAVPNWTSRLPIVGWQLGGLAALWVLGRIAVAFSVGLPSGLVAALDLTFPVALGAAIAREIIAGKNWRNLVVLGMLAVFASGNALFHLEAASGSFAAQGYGLRLGVGAGIMMIAVIGGRIVPSFTRNWMVKRGENHLPASPMQRLDKLSLLLLLGALLSWVALPFHALTGVLLLATGLVHLMRLARWHGHRTFAEPLVTVLHVGYLFLPLGALAVSVEVLTGGHARLGVVQHLWMGGALGLMTRAVMTRATLGHTGQDLHAGVGTVAIYSLLVISVMLRVAVGAWPAATGFLYSGSGITWVAAFGGFVVFYGRLLLRLPASKKT